MDRSFILAFLVYQIPKSILDIIYHSLKCQQTSLPQLEQDWHTSCYWVLVVWLLGQAVLFFMMWFQDKPTHDEQLPNKTSTHSHWFERSTQWPLKRVQTIYHRVILGLTLWFFAGYYVMMCLEHPVYKEKFFS